MPSASGDNDHDLDDRSIVPWATGPVPSAPRIEMPPIDAAWIAPPPSPRRVSRRAHR
jgi:hypothetical protein